MGAEWIPASLKRAKLTVYRHFFTISICYF